MAQKSVDLNAILDQFRREEKEGYTNREKDMERERLANFERKFRALMTGIEDISEKDITRKRIDKALAAGMDYDLIIAREIFGASKLDYKHGEISIHEQRDMSGRKLRHAKITDFKEWLAGYLQRGRMPTHSYDYPMSDVINKFYLAIADFKTASLYGANSINIIVPKNVRYLEGELGHNELYLMEGFENKGGIVPVYSDIKF